MTTIVDVPSQKKKTLNHPMIFQIDQYQRIFDWQKGFSFLNLA